jgi:hypothetical protein
MRLQLALPASLLLLVIASVALVHPPRTSSESPKQLVARAGLGAIRAIVGAGDRAVAPEVAQSPAPLTLASSRPDSVGPAADPDGVAAIERYHERAIQSARARTMLVVTDDAAGARVKSLAVAEFEQKCARTEKAAVKKPECTKSALDLPIVGCYLRQATSILIS